MQLSFFKPNSSNTGHALSFKVQRYKDKDVLMLEFVKQASWNAESKTGSFSANAKDKTKKCSVKFEPIEVGAIINTIKRHLPSSFFHKGADYMTKISLSVYEKKAQEGQAPQKAFSLGVIRGEAKFSASLEFSEAELLLSFLQKYLNDFVFKSSVELVQQDH